MPSFHMVSGLSPRVRGNPVFGGCLLCLQRSIPACAGEPRRRAPGVARYRVYPRVCGGTLSASAKTSAPYGLSPRVRGNPLPPSRTNCRAGSIPACAGEPTDGVIQSISYMVYPRVCGGTLPSLSAGLTTTRSIPACAGEPSLSAPASLPLRVYPRVCGGTYVGYLAVFKRPGLSPRVRGNHMPMMPYPFPASLSSPSWGQRPTRNRRPLSEGVRRVPRRTNLTIRTYHLAPPRVNVSHSHDVSPSLDSTVFCLTRSLCSR